MVNANELRIGNWVLINNPEYHPQLMGNPVIVKGIYDRGGYIINVDHGEDQYSQYLSFVRPIPLDPEILEKCGFKISNGNIGEFYSNRYPIGKSLGLKALVEGEFLLINFHTRFKYLHEFQNLYFSLVGEELDVQVSDTTKA